MPIGFQRGDSGGDRSSLPAASRPTPEQRDAVASRPQLIPTFWSRWVTANDERTCPECAPLDGAAWPIDDGPRPPLHTHCRCERVAAFVSYESRKR